MNPIDITKKKVFICMCLGIFIYLFGSTGGLFDTQQAFAQELKKIRYGSQEEIQQLRKSGADIIVLEEDYAIIRIHDKAKTRSFPAEKVKEEDFVQRLVYIHLKNSDDIQDVVDLGVDVWEVKDLVVIASALDIYIERLREKGFIVEIKEKNIKHLRRK